MVAHYRKAGGASVLGPDCNAIIGLAAASGYVPGAKLPAGVAQDMLCRDAMMTNFFLGLLHGSFVMQL